MDLLKSVLDGQNDWFIVTDAQDKKIIYANLSARLNFYDVDLDISLSDDYKVLLQKLIPLEATEFFEQEYQCININQLLFIRSFPIDWNEKSAYVHRITDITNDRGERTQLQNLAYMDSLTNTYNRRYCVDKIKTFMDNKISFSYVLVDLDGLKKVNDKMGHSCGDDYIITTAKVISSLSRSDDRLCRVGGDEFVLILPHCTEENSHKKLEVISEKLSNYDKSYKLSISYGIVYVDEYSELTENDVYKLSDKRMYTMKFQNRQKY